MRRILLLLLSSLLPLTAAEPTPRNVSGIYPHLATFNDESERGRGQSVTYRAFTVGPGQSMVHRFTHAFSASWVRVVAEKDATATETFVYD